MPRLGTAHVYRLAQKVTSETPMQGRTPAERGILYYLRMRQLEGLGGATQAQMTEDSGMTDRTVGTAVRNLVREGFIA